jgi:hypothetical protein
VLTVGVAIPFREVKDRWRQSVGGERTAAAKHQHNNDGSSKDGVLLD